MSERQHEYLYTVEIRIKGKWEQRQVIACNISQAQHKLGVTEKDCRYVNKTIVT